ncbi:hypothetical protein LTR36_009792 [Oleoguttula mirabilis]|uniref:Uncharacterized protein n=1 Tax=Oleoguttula mirabilis TaxID=1507867 RepID=A0AAV9J5I5_9PEZI|nr:hypothetical protein LTR36_009792 [Oleoguttula mirabilis]
MRFKMHNYLVVPAELRNRIWFYALQDQPQVSDGSALELMDPCTNYHTAGADEFTPAVTRLSRQIRSEVLPIALATTVIEIKYTNFGGRDRALQWLISIGNLARFIRRVKVYAVVSVARATLDIELMNVPGLVQFSVECFHGDNPVSGRRAHVAKKLWTLKKSLMDRFYGRRERKLSSNDWVGVLQLVDGFFDRSYAPFPFAGVNA